MARRKLFNNFIRFQPDKKPSDRSDLPIVDKGKDLISDLDATTITSVDQLNQFRNLSDDRQTQYNAYDEMKSDSIIAAALELYADDATQYDEQGRVIWVESDSDEITKAANRLIEILDLPERAWKHIYQTCLYGDYYLKLYRRGDVEEEDEYLSQRYKSIQTRIVNDTKVTSRNGKEVSEKILGFEEYVEDVEDPALLFDLRKRGKSAGFIEIGREVYMNQVAQIASTSFTFQTTDISVYPPDRFVHIMLSENLSRTPEEVQIDLGDSKVATYQSARGKSMLQDVYPIQKELQLLEDSLLLNRLTRSSLIRLLEIEVGDMPKQEVNPYLRRIKNLIEQHISMDKSNGDYKSYNAPGPIDNVIYIPTRNGKGSITVNNLGGDVNVRDIADIDYFNNKRAGALKIPRAYLGDDMDGSGLSNGGSLTRLSARYARTIKRIQTAYIRAITHLLNLFFIEKKLDYVNKFKVRMTSPSTQEDLERNELIGGNIDIVSSILDLTSSLEGSTQKKVLSYLVSNIMKMPEISQMIDEDVTPEEDVDIEGAGSPGGPDLNIDFGGEAPSDEVGVETETPETTEEPSSTEGGFSDEDFSEFEDTL